jgi:hypothetical protein
MYLKELVNLTFVCTVYSFTPIQGFWAPYHAAKTIKITE